MPLTETPPTVNAADSASVKGTTGRTSARTARPEQKLEERLAWNLEVNQTGIFKITCPKSAGTSSARSTAPGEERWYVKYHRPRNRPSAAKKRQCVPPVEGAQRVRHQSISRGRLEPGVKQEGFYVFSLKNNRKYIGMLKSTIERHRPNTTDRDRCEGERQCGGDTDRRSTARAGIAKKPGLWEAAVRTAPRGP